MTTGLDDRLESYEVPNRGPAAWVHYGSKTEWNGEDRPFGVTLHPPRPNSRRRQYRITVRRDHHVVHEFVDKPLKWEGDLTTEEIQDKTLFFANHPYWKTWEVRAFGLLDIVQYNWSDGSVWGTWTGTVSNGGALPVMPTNRWTSDDDFKMLSKLEERVKGSDFNLASFLGAEGIDTVRFIADTATRLYRAGIAVKRGYFQRALSILRDENQQWLRAESKRLGVDVVSARRVSRWKDRQRRHEQELVYKDQVRELRMALAGDKSPAKSKSVLANLARISSNQWLEFHLAAEPLLGDVKAAAEQLASRLNIPQRKAYSVKRKREWNITYPSYGAAFSQNELLVKKRIKFIVTEPVSIPRLLGLYNPEVVIWNAIPLTFVGDYFLPIGQWLEARALAQALTGEFVVSTKTEWVAGGLHFRNDINVNPLLYATWQVGSCWCRQGSLIREVTTGLPIPTPRFKPLGAFASWSKAATSVSLLVGSVTGGNLLRHLR